MKFGTELVLIAMLNSCVFFGLCKSCLAEGDNLGVRVKEVGMTEKATFAAGCFWGVEETFRKQTGVLRTAVGYTGGSVPNPSYELVCSDRTGHAEALEIEYDPKLVSYEALLDLFWSIHDPTTLNRQGPDLGSQYRSAIFFHSEKQRKSAEASKQRLEGSGNLHRPIVTQIVAAAPFYRAEEYHQRYLEKRGAAECSLHK